MARHTLQRGQILMKRDKVEIKDELVKVVTFQCNVVPRLTLAEDAHQVIPVERSVVIFNDLDFSPKA